MKRLAILGILVGAGYFSAPARASEWKYLTSGSSGAAALVDVQSVRELPPIAINRPFKVRTLWVKMNFQYDNSVKYRETVMLYYFNCDAETSEVISSTTYNPDGRVVKSFSDRDYDFKYEPLTPDTIGYALMEFACGRRSVPVP